MKKIYLLFLFFILIGFGYFVTFNDLDPDFGWHLKTGELILERGIPKVDWYSFTMPDFLWINHEWLTDVLIYKIYSSFGFQILLLFFLVLTASAFIISIKRELFGYFIFPILLGYFASFSFFGIRPQIITILFVTILLKVLNEFLENPKSRLIYSCPFLFLIWVNLHGGFFAGLFILFLILALEIFKKSFFFNKLISWPLFQKQNYKTQSSQKILILFFILVLSSLATLINPYKWDIYQEVFRTIGDPYLGFHITEWLPLFLISGHLVFIILYFGFFFGLLIPQYKKIEFNNLFLILVFTIFAFLHIRHFFLFVILTIPIFVQLIFYFKKEITPEGVRLLLGGFKKWIIVLIFLLLFGYGIYPFVKDALKGDMAFDYPQKALAILKTLSLSENLLNEYSWGGYLIWQLPERKLFIDGRMPSWRKDDRFVFGDYIKIMEAKDNFQELLEKYNIKIALLNKNKKEEGQKFEEENLKTKNKLKEFFKRHNTLSKILGIKLPRKNIYNYLIEEGWQIIYEDEIAVILRR